jgi:catechol 2,3-dioxygenase-like lactoylglutathione lyase family enzyme
MTSIHSVALEVAELAAAERFYATAFALDDRVRLRAGAQPTSGFRGFTLSLLVAQPADVDHLMHAASANGATQLKPAKKQLWGGYSGVVHAPDGTIWKAATESKRNTGAGTGRIEGITLILGVSDMSASKQFYTDRGLTVSKSFGSRYVDFDAPTGTIKLGLYRRRGLAKDARVPADGRGSHRLVVRGNSGAFTDPDGFVWET